jgi:hypothetical protein
MPTAKPSPVPANASALRIHKRRLAREARVVQSQSRDVTPTLEELVGDARVPVFTAVVVAR